MTETSMLARSNTAELGLENFTEETNLDTDTVKGYY